MTAAQAHPAGDPGDIIRASLAESRKTTGRRHPAEVTSDRLGDAVTDWGECFTPDELDMVGHIRHRLECIAEDRTAGEPR